MPSSNYYTDNDNGITSSNLLQNRSKGLNELMRDSANRRFINTAIEWERVFNEDGIAFFDDNEEIGGRTFDFGFATKMPLEQAEQARQGYKDFLSLYQDINNMMKSVDNYYIEDDQFKSSVLSLAITFDFFNSTNKEQVKKQIVEWLKEKIMPDNEVNMAFKLDKFNAIFGQLTCKHDRAFLEDIIKNYDKIELGYKVNRYGEAIGLDFTMEEGLKTFLQNPDYNFRSVEDLNKCIVRYGELIPEMKLIKSYLVDNTVSMEDIGKLQNAFIRGLNQETSNLPFLEIDEDENNIYNMYKFWDIQQLLLDVDNQYKNIGADRLCQIIGNPNARIMEIQNKQSGNRNYIIITREGPDISIKSVPETMIPQEVQEKITSSLYSSLNEDDRIDGISFADKEIPPIETSLDNTCPCKYKDSPYICYNKGRDFGRKDRLLDREYFYRIHNAFAEHKVGHSERQDTKNDIYYIGRDWCACIERDPKGEYTSLETIARFNSQKGCKTGSKEMAESFLEIINSTDGKVYGAAHSPVYFFIAKLASEGKLVIESDEQKIITGSGLQSTGLRTGTYYNQDEMSENFPIKIIPEFLIGGGTNENNIQSLTMSRIDENRLGDNDYLEKIERQKRVYGQVVNFLTTYRKFEQIQLENMESNVHIEPDISQQYIDMMQDPTITDVESFLAKFKEICDSSMHEKAKVAMEIYPEAYEAIKDHFNEALARFKSFIQYSKSPITNEIETDEKAH